MKYKKVNNQTFLLQYPDKGEPVHPCMDALKAKHQFDGSLDKLKLRIVARGDLKKGISWRHLVTNSLHEDFKILLGRCK